MKRLLLVSLATVLSVAAFSQASNASKDSIYNGFVTPPQRRAATCMVALDE